MSLNDHSQNATDEVLSVIENALAIPHYAYGDNEAACQMQRALEIAAACLRTQPAGPYSGVDVCEAFKRLGWHPNSVGAGYAWEVLNELKNTAPQGQGEGTYGTAGAGKPTDTPPAEPVSEAGKERDPNDPDPVEHAKELAAALFKARIELIDARKDAARYRWLRDTDDNDWNRLLRDGGDQMDANIDAAMAEQSAATDSAEG